MTPPQGIETLRRRSPFAVELRYDDQVIPLLTREEAEVITSSVLGWATELVTQAAQ